MTLVRRFIWWLQRRRKEDQLREELEFHVDEETLERDAPLDAIWATRRG
jgi:hypothetical protein